MTTDAKQEKSASHNAWIIIGFGMYWTWVYCSFNQSSSINPDLLNSPDMLWAHLSSMLVGALAYAFVLFAPRRNAVQTSKRSFVLTASLLAALGTLLFTLSPAPSVKVAGGILTGIGTVPLLLVWGSVFSKLSAREIVLDTVTAFLIANTMYFAQVLALSSTSSSQTVQPVLTVLVACALIVSALLCLHCDITAGAHSGSSSVSNQSESASSGSVNGVESRADHSAQLHRVPWKLCLGLFVVMCVYGNVRVFVGMEAPTSDHGLEVTAFMVFGICLLFMVWGAFLQGRRTGLGIVYKSLLPILSASLLLVADFGSGWSLSGPLASMFNVAIEILSWIVLADVVRITSAESLYVFAAGRMCVQAGMFFGQTAAWFIPASIDMFTFVGVVALMAAMGFMFNDQGTEYLFEPPTESELSQMSQEGMGLQNGVPSGIADEFGLTEREREIFDLWVTGHGSKYIQDALSISQSTVKTHIRHIYEKFDVHSRADLMALLEKGNERR